MGSKRSSGRGRTALSEVTALRKTSGASARSTTTVNCRRTAPSSPAETPLSGASEFEPSYLAAHSGCRLVPIRYLSGHQTAACIQERGKPGEANPLRVRPCNDGLRDVEDHCPGHRPPAAA